MPVAPAGPFTSLTELVERIDLRLCNKRVLERWSPPVPAIRWAATGAADRSARGRARRGPAEAAGPRRGPGVAVRRGARLPARHLRLPDIPPWTEAERLAREKEVLGFFISGHPLERFRDEVELFGSRTTATLGEWSEHQVNVAAVVTGVKRQISKQTGKEYARLVLEDFHGTAEAIVFPDAWAKLNQSSCPMRRCCSPAGTASGIGGKSALRSSWKAPVRWTISSGRAPWRSASAGARPEAPAADVVKAAAALCTAHPGPTPVYIDWSDGNGEVVRLRSRRLRVAAEDDLVRALRNLLGADSVHYVKAG